MEEISFYHQGKMGDVIMSLPLIKAMGGGKLYLEDGPELLEGSMASMISFLEMQDYISPVLGKPEGSYIDLNRFRDSYSLHTQHIIKTYFQTFGVKFSLINLPFLKMPDPNAEFEGCNLINITPRYSTATFASTIKELAASGKRDRKWYFVGTPQEFESWEGSPNISFVPTLNTKDLASMVAGASTVYCNQSLVYTLALLSGKYMIADTRQITCAVKSPMVVVADPEIQKMIDANDDYIITQLPPKNYDC